MQTKGKILITGCAGFIGSRTTEMLSNDGYNVVGVDNLNDYYDVSLKEHRLASLRELKGFQFEKLDVESEEGVSELFKQHQFDAVVNLAARAGVRYSMKRPSVYMATNAVGTLNILEAMRTHECKKFVLASTSSLYAGQPMPFVETLPVNTPISPYAATKKAAEVMAYAYHHLYGFDVSVVRYFTVYGPADRPDMAIHRFIQWIDQGVPITLFGDGTQSRDFTYVDDIARGTIAAITPVGYEIVNLGGGKNPVMINSVINRLESLLQKKAVIEYQPAFDADMKSTWANIDKAKQLLDWTPTISLDDGLERCVEWYRRNLPWSSEISLETP